MEKTSHYVVYRSAGSPALPSTVARRSNSTPRFVARRYDFSSAGVSFKRSERKSSRPGKNAATDIWKGERIFSVNEIHETTESIELRWNAEKREIGVQGVGEYNEKIHYKYVI